MYKINGTCVHSKNYCTHRNIYRRCIEIFLTPCLSIKLKSHNLSTHSYMDSNLICKYLTRNCFDQTWQFLWNSYTLKELIHFIQDVVISLDYCQLKRHYNNNVFILHTLALFWTVINRMCTLTFWL